MARLSKEEHDEILGRLSDASNADPEMMDLVGRLRSDFDESLSVDVSEVERSWQEKYNALASERDTVIGERDEARRAYRERYFSNAAAEAEAIVNREKKDSPKGMNEILGINKEDII